MTHEWMPSAELAALAKRERMIKKTELISRGVSPVLADWYLDRQEACIRALADEIAEEIMTTGSSAGGGLLSLLEANDNDPKES